MSDEIDDYTIDHDPAGQAFFLRDGDRQIGRIFYLPYGPDGKQRVLYHTGIDEEYGGRGLAGRLTAAALAETVAEGLTIVPVCPYITAYLRKHPEYADRATEVLPEHLAVVPEKYRP
ncbi:GNAT family N-acetyltransferase [Raineyella sp. LH-20]|uniref:GNAT family N-acetyltransferase n=1 Tax=Raineyella sp. LH-20 TaxID=3081204 RepID=UPI002955A086|nr:GNAT family N-acetyltransferase [Raineyella sp. LH-20]WOP19479.1 GNAT family N-acetyltransferase [Raineyella sp. LH-20]